MRGIVASPQFQKYLHPAWVYFVDHHFLGQPALVLSGVMALMVLEVTFRDWKKTALYRIFVRRSTSAKIDVFYYILQYAGLAGLLEILFSFGFSFGGARAADLLSEHLGWARVSLPADGPLEVAFSFLIYWVVSGFTNYWFHRIYHWQVFWQVHRFHHAAPELNFITAYRIHPVESALRVFNALSPMIFFKVPDSVIFVGLVIGNFVVFCQHSELPWDWGWVGRWIFASPLNHQVHHSIDDEHRDTNFSNCPLWDHVFGTWYDGTKAPSRYGILDVAYAQQPVAQFLRDTWTFYWKLGGWLLQPARKALSIRIRTYSGQSNTVGLQRPD